MEIEGPSSKKQEMNNKDNQVSVDIDKLEESMNMELEALHPLSNKCCIYRVHVQLQDLKAYTPQFVSIGPLHHGKQELKVMEEHKRRYLKDFLRRSKLTLQDLIKATEENETKLKECFEETIDIPKEDFIKLMLVASVFLIEYFLKCYFEDFQIDDRIQRMRSDINLDLLLLENQVPFFFLAYLLSKFDHEGLSMTKILHSFLTWSLEIEETKDIISSAKTSPRVEHLVDILRINILPSKLNQKKQCTSFSTPTISHLYQAGVKLKSSSSKCLLRHKIREWYLGNSKMDNT